MRVTTSDYSQECKTAADEFGATLRLYAVRSANGPIRLSTYPHDEAELTPAQAREVAAHLLAWAETGSLELPAQRPPTVGNYSDCCADGHCRIECREASESYGPEVAGWCVIDGMTDHGAAHTYGNINFCPWCGQRPFDAANGPQSAPNENGLAT